MKRRMFVYDPKIVDENKVVEDAWRHVMEDDDDVTIHFHDYSPTIPIPCNSKCYRLIKEGDEVARKPPEGIASVTGSHPIRH
jgi:hypothetical protein